MKFIVGKSKQTVVQVARLELQWERIREWKMLDLFNDEVMVISKASEMNGHAVEIVYLLPGFDDLPHDQWEEFQHDFVSRKIKTKRL